MSPFKSVLSWSRCWVEKGLGTTENHFAEPRLEHLVEPRAQEKAAQQLRSASLVALGGCAIVAHGSTQEHGRPVHEDIGSLRKKSKSEFGGTHFGEGQGQ